MRIMRDGEVIELTQAEEDAFEADRAPGPVQVPERVTALQGMLALEQYNLDSAFETWAADPARTFRERAFLDKADYWRRSSEVIESARVALGLTEAQVDDMFIAAQDIDP